MGPNELQFLELVAPILFVLGTVYVLGPMLPVAQTWARGAVFAVVWLMVARYLDWRLFTTVLPAAGSFFEISWVWLCFAIELLAFADQLILYMVFLRVTDRRSEADRHEARLRATAAEELPSVDVYIATYNEPPEILEKTIIGALCLDYPNFNVWVLDDGRRAWLRTFCESKGVGYMTRPDNAHAKAGNINHALAQTTGDFVAIFDADFIPQRNFLIRTLGFFADPRVGIVQIPHSFYNDDPMQANLALRQTLPDEQRFFFDAIMPSRDGWDAAFCCGSNSVTRRTALQAVGGGLPTQSITEDMLLTLVLLRHGYVTRYLSEPLAFGLAPEDLNAFFVQRQRWARGAIQTTYLRTGPFGRNLTLMQRLAFLPTHWLSLGFTAQIAFIAPLVFLWTGVSPLVNASVQSVVYYLVPVILAMFGGIWAFAPRHHFPLAAQVLSAVQSFKILPTVLLTLIKPFGHVFKVTPKGAGARTTGYDPAIFWPAALLMAATVAGLILNTTPEWRIVDQVALLPMVAFWSSINIVVLFLVCMIALQAPARRSEERFALDDEIWLFGASGTLTTGKIADISMSGVGLVPGRERAFASTVGERVRVFVPEVGFIAGTVARIKERFLGVQFDLPAGVERDLLIRKLFTAGMETTAIGGSLLSVTFAMLKRIWSVRTELDAGASVALPTPSADKLPARSAVISPHPQRLPLKTLVEQRRRLAA